jgi:hypothetical protein
MTAKDADEFRKLIVGTAGVFGSYLPPESIPIWFDDLESFSIEEIKTAFKQFRKNADAQKMPTSGQISFMIREARKSTYKLPDVKQEKLPEGFFKKIFEQLETDATEQQKKDAKEHFQSLQNIMEGKHNEKG